MMSFNNVELNEKEMASKVYNIAISEISAALGVRAPQSGTPKERFAKTIKKIVKLKREAGKLETNKRKLRRTKAKLKKLKKVTGS